MCIRDSLKPCLHHLTAGKQIPVRPGIGCPGLRHHLIPHLFQDHGQEFLYLFPVLVPLYILRHGYCLKICLKVIIVLKHADNRQLAAEKIIHNGHRIVGLDIQKLVIQR